MGRMCNIKSDHAHVNGALMFVYDRSMLVDPTLDIICGWLIDWKCVL